jgi:hypothetical protein
LNDSLYLFGKCKPDGCFCGNPVHGFFQGTTGDLPGSKCGLARDPDGGKKSNPSHCEPPAGKLDLVLP